MKTTRYFDATRQRADRAGIQDVWVVYVIRNPVKEVVQSDGRTRRWAPIADADGRFLRVVLLEDGETKPFTTRFSTEVSQLGTEGSGLKC